MNKLAIGQARWRHGKRKLMAELGRRKSELDAAHRDGYNSAVSWVLPEDGRTLIGHAPDMPVCRVGCFFRTSVYDDRSHEPYDQIATFEADKMRHDINGTSVYWYTWRLTGVATEPARDARPRYSR